MNNLLKQYCISVEFPYVSGAEHLEMLYQRDQLAKIAENLTDLEKTKLKEADGKLIAKAAQFYTELSRFVNLVQHPQSEQISPQRWWWYLDVISYLPQIFITSEVA